TTAEPTRRRQSLADYDREADNRFAAADRRACVNEERVPAGSLAEVGGDSESCRHGLAEHRVAHVLAAVVAIVDKYGNAVDAAAGRGGAVECQSLHHVAAAWQLIPGLRITDAQHQA